MRLRNRILVQYIFLTLVILLSLHRGYSQVTIYSSGNGRGDWSDTLSWSGYIIPGISDTAIVVSGDTVTVDSANYSVAGLTIQSGATVLHNNNNLSIYGNYLNNGQHIAYGGNRIYFRGVGTTIDGTGIVYNTGLIRVYDGDKTFPASADLTFGPSEVRVWTGITMHNYGNLDFQGRINGYAGSTWINEANSRVDVGYDIFISATLVANSTGNTVNYYRPATFDVTRTSDSSYYNLEISGTGLKRLTGPTTILGDLVMTARLTTQKWPVELKGNYTNTSFITPDSSLISFTGTGDQTLSNPAGETFYNVSVNKASGSLILAGNLTVTDTLRMDGGDIVNQPGELVLGSSSHEGILIHTAGRITGKLKRWVTSTGTNILLPAGDGSNDYPVILNFTDLTPGTISAEYIGTNPGTGGLPLIEGTDTIYNVFTEGYWNLTPGDGLASTDYDIQLLGTGFSSFDTDSARILKRASGGAPWVFDGTHVQASNDTARRTGLSGFSQFAFGAPDSCDVPATSAIVGLNSVCINDPGVSYSVTNSPGSSYAWTITGGALVGSGNSITVNWGATGMAGEVRVIETNACGDGVPVTLDVNIHPLPTSSIAGPTSVPEGTTGIEYSVTSQVGYTYAWVVTGGTLVSGDGTNEIIVDWGAAGSGSVQITSTHSCGSAAPVILNVNKYSGIKSIQTGDWDDPLTWDCNCVPANTDNIIISSGDSVYLVAVTTIQNLHIDSGAVLNQPSLNFFVQGDYRVDGDHTGSPGGIIYLDGINTEISGTGIITKATGLQMRYGNKMIPAGTNLSKPENYVYLAGNVVVTNYGEVTFGDYLYAVNSTSVWINKAGSVLNAGGIGANPIMWRGVLIASEDNNTVAIVSGETQNIKVPQSNTYYNLIVGGGSSKTLLDDIIVKGDLSISSVLSAGTYSINLAGDWTNTGVFNEGTGSVVFDGIDDQSITNTNSETFYDLQTAKASGDLNLNDNVSISDTLYLYGGNIITGINKIIIGTDAGNTGGLIRSAGSIVGQVERWITATGEDFLLPVGTSQWYRPVQINFNSILGGSLIAEFEESTPGNQGLSLVDGLVTVNNTFSEGYWKLTTANSLASSDFNLDVIANGFTSFSIEPDTRLLSRSGPSGDWSADGSHVAADVYTVSRDNVSILSGEYAVGDTNNCTPPVTTGFTGSTSVCTNATGEIYSVNQPGGSTFEWTVTGGFIMSGQGSNSISVNWGPSGMTGQVEVRETSTCGTGEAIIVDVEIHPQPTQAIYGPSMAYAGETGVVYNVIEQSGYTYSWSVSSEGNIVGASVNDSISVDWNTAGAATVQVTSTHTVCALSADPLALDITVADIITSVQDGDWATASTWDCNCLPGNSANIIIAAGDTITVNANTRVNDLTIEATAQLNSLGNQVTITGDYTVNGDHTGTGTAGQERIYLDGLGTSIDGTGTISNTGRLRIRQGSKTILSGANLTKPSGDFYINNNLTVTNNGQIFLGGNVWTDYTTVYWINAEGSTLTLGNEFFRSSGQDGNLVASATGNTVRYVETADQFIKPPENGTYYNLVLAGSANKIMAGDIKILNDISISTNLNSVTYDIEVEGNWLNTSTFVEGTGSVSFTGNSDQFITNASTETFYDLFIQKESGVLTLDDNVVVINDLSLVQGEIDAGSNILFLGTDAANEGSFNYTSGRILGKFRRWIEATTTGTDIEFPVGSAGVTRAVVVNFSNLTAGTLTAEFFATNPGIRGLPLVEGGDSIGNVFTEGYWSLEQGNGLASTDYELKLNGTGFSSFIFDNKVRILKRNSGASPWLLDGTHVAPIGFIANRTSMSGFSEFGLGSSSTCDPPVTSMITGSSSVCTNDAGVSYSVIETPGSSYTWTVTGGSVASGQGTYDIMVNWGPSGMAGQVQVVENNGCADGVPVSLEVDIHPLPTSVITGPVSVPENSTGVGYFVVNTAGYTYNWVISGGTLASGDGTNNVTVDWGTSGIGDVQVTADATGGCGSDNPVNLEVTIYSAIRSVQSGNFTDPLTWDCNCDPPSMASIVIDSGHVVTMTRSDSADNLTIDKYGTLDNQNFRMVVFNNYTVNGTHTGNAGTGTEQLRLQGIGSTINGTGLISMTGRVYCITGSKTILQTADINIPNSYFRLVGNVVVTNQGSITINTYLYGDNSNSTWINDVNSTLNAGAVNTNPIMFNGTLVANASGNTVNLIYGLAQNIVDPSNHTFYNLTVGGGNNKTLLDNVIVLGDLSISSTLLSGGYDIDLKGDWINAGVYTPGTGAVTLSGTGDQTITNLIGETFYDLILSKASGDVNLGGNVTISDTLTMGGGDIITSDKSLVIGTGTGNTGHISHVTGKIVGTLERWINSTGSDILYPIGTSTFYRPAIINFNNLTGGSLIADFEETAPGNLGLPKDDAGTMVHNAVLEGYWTLNAANSLASNSFNLSLKGTGFTSFPINPKTRIISRTSSGADWEVSGTHFTAQSDTARRAGISILSGEYALGDTVNCSPPATSAIAGPIDVCINDVGVVYSVDVHGGSSYDWTVTGGSIATGQGSAVINVNWGPTGMIGTVEVIETNACSEGERQELLVDVGPVPTSAINGSVTAGAGSTGNIYYVQQEQDYTYTWAVSSQGALSSPNGNDSITINWSTAGTATIDVTATDPGCSADADPVYLNVEIYDVILSAQDGDWDDPATWIGGVVPNQITSARIQSGDSVWVIAQPRRVNNLTIDAGGVLNSTDRDLYIYGDYTINGIHYGTGGDNIRFYGGEAVFTGSGTVSTNGRVRVYTGNKTFDVSSDITFTNGFYISNNLIVTNNGTVTIGFQLLGQNASSTWVNATDAVLNVEDNLIYGSAGNIVASATGNIVNYYGGAETVKQPVNNDYYHLSITGTGTKTLEGDINVNGDLTITNTLATADFDIYLKGDWINQNLFNEGLGEVIFSGSGDQSITNPVGETFYDLRINKPGGSLLQNNGVRVSNDLNMIQGNIVTSGNSLILGTGIGSTGTINYTAGIIVGALERWIDTPSLPYDFPLGTASVYLPASLTFATLSPGGSLVGEFIPSAPGNQGMPLDDAGQQVNNTFNEGYWTFTRKNALSPGNYDIALTATGFSTFPVVDETRIVTRTDDLSDWTINGTHAPAVGSVINRSAVNTTSVGSEFAIADTADCNTPVTSAITGSSSVCINDGGEFYNVDFTGGSTYDWTVTGGSIVSGQGTATIEVDWGSTGMMGLVQVVETNSCAAGAPVSLDVEIKPLPTSAITGLTDVAENTMGVPYSVISNGYTYNWIITGGTLASGDGTNSITVDWGTAGAGNVRVTGVDGCGSAAPVDLPVTKYDVITSVASGDFNAPGTWDCGCDPPAYSSIVIDSGHVVTMTVTDTVGSLTINEYGELDNSTFRIRIFGHYTVNGIHSGTSGAGDYRIYLMGNGTYIDGTGTISHPGVINITNNHKTILSTADIKRSADARLDIEDNIVVTNYGIFEQNGNMYGSTNSVWYNAENSTLRFGEDAVIGTMTLNASGTNNTVEYDRAGTQAITIPFDNSYQNLIISGSGNKNLGTNISIEGDLTISSILNSNNNNIQLKGDWSNSGVFNAGTGQVTLVGASDQTITNPIGETFYDLMINDVTGTVLLNNDVTISNTLTMNGGDINTQGNTLTLGLNTGSIGDLTYSSGTIIGEFERWISGTGTNFHFPIGNSSHYRPVDIIFTDLTPGSLIAEFITSPPGNSGLPLTDGTVDISNAFLDGYWALTRANALASTNYDLDLTGTGFSSFTIVDETRLLIRENSSSDWTVEGTHEAASADTVRRNNLATLSAEYGLGDTTVCTPPVTSPITGNNSVCAGATGESYTVTLNAGSSYQWTITGGSITSGQGTNTVEVDWGSTGMMGSVEVIESNSCTQGAPELLDIEIHPLPTSVITGETNVAAGATGVVYSVTNRPNYDYNWTITGGTQVPVSTAATITVDWGTGSSGKVSVVAENTVCSQSAAAEELDITIYPVITSVTDGQWSNPATWDCSCVPGASSNVIIAAGDSVAVTAATPVNNLTIESGAVLNTLTNRITITGDYIVDGEHMGSGNDNIYLNGVDTKIGGSGTISHSGYRLRVRVGNKEILSSADLSQTAGSFYIENNLTVTNNGSISIAGQLYTDWNTVNWINASGATLVAGNGLLEASGGDGVLIASAPGNTIIYQEAGTQVVKVPQNGEYYNLSIEGTGIKSMIGDITVLNDLSISSTLNSANFDIEIGGDWTNTNTFTEGTGTVTFNGTGPQSITNPGGEIFNNLTVNKAVDTLSLGGDVIAGAVLDMTSGNIVTGSYTLTLGLDAVNNGTLNRTTGTVVGKFERWVKAAATAYLFPVGTALNYNPAIVTFNNVPTGSLIAEFNSSAPGNSGLPINDAGVNLVNTFVEGYWSLTKSNGLSSTDYRVDLKGDGFTTFPIVDETRILTRTSVGADWTADGIHVDASGDTASRNTISTLSAEFAFADTSSCSLPVTSVITGSNSVCTGTTNSNYSVINTPGSTYAWTVDGGTITSAQGLNFVFIDWGTTGMTGYVEVIEDNGCGLGSPVRIDVDINPVPTSAISGNIAVASGATGEIYSVIETPGYDYNWSISGDGTISPPSDLSGTITVDWGTAGTATVSVVGGNGCGNAAQVDLNVDIYDVFVTAQSGNWNDGSTWVGGIVPTSVNSARIASGDTVEVYVNSNIRNLIIDAGGVLDSRDRYMSITGDYTLNGLHTGNGGDRIRLDGLGTTIDGTGTYSHTGYIRIRYGNKIIASTADLTLDDMYINTNLQITNNGSVDFRGGTGIGGAAGALWVNAANSYLRVQGDRVMNGAWGGSLTASAIGNTVEYARDADRDIETPTGNAYYNLVIAGTFSKNMVNDLSIYGDLSISAELNTNNNELQIEGNWTNTGIFTAGTGTVIFNGSGDQTITSSTTESFYDLNIYKGSGKVILSGNIGVSNELILTSGIVETGTSKITLGTSAVSTGTLTNGSGWIYGKFERWISAGVSDYNFPVGTVQDNNPVLIDFNDAPSGSLIAEFLASSPGNGGLPLSESSFQFNNTFGDGYWRLSTANSLVSTDYDLQLVGNGLSAFPIHTDTRLLTRSTGTTDWLLDGTHVTANPDTAKRNNITLLSAEYAFADTSSCSPPSTSAISGSTQRCINDAGIPYFVTNTPGSTYTWSITGGTVNTGQGTNSITVNWGSTGMVGQVQVIENNGCTDGAPVTLDVDVGPLPTSVIAGPVSAAVGETGMIYSVVPIAGYTYDWTLSPEGSITSGDGTDIITVDWSTSGTATLSVVGTNSCGDAAEEDLEIEVFDVFVSALDGAWNVGATWVGGISPPEYANVRIATGHTVSTVTNPTRVTNLIIDNGAVLANGGNIIEIYGNYTLNGNHTGNGTRIRLYGQDTYIDGTGTVDAPGDIYI